MSEAISRPAAGIQGRAGELARARTSVQPGSALSILIARARAGDQRAMREIYMSHRLQVRAHLVRLLGSDSEIDDLVQIVFSRAFVSLDRFNEESSLSTWLFKITLNTSRNLHRQRYRKRRISQAFQWFSTSLGLHVHSEATVDSRDEALRVLSHLSPELREVFVLYHHEGLTLQEMSLILQRPVSTIGDLLTKARKRVRDIVCE